MGMAATRMTPAQRMKIGKAQAAFWKRLTPKQHAARVRKMLSARGLKPRK